MYNSKDGSWIEIAGERPYEFEATYYLKYNIEKALIALKNIFKTDIDFSEYSNYCVYYHIQIDSLMQACGQIHDRFLGNDEARKEINCINYDFNKEIYPLLSSKVCRNFIEHINQRNYNLINEYGKVGGFNTINKDTKIIKEKLTLLPHNNCLDLENYLYYYYDNTQKQNGFVDLKALKVELEKLSERNKKIFRYITELF